LQKQAQTVLLRVPLDGGSPITTVRGRATKDADQGKPFILESLRPVSYKRSKVVRICQDCARGRRRQTCASCSTLPGDCCGLPSPARARSPGGSQRPKPDLFRVVFTFTPHTNIKTKLAGPSSRTLCSNPTRTIRSGSGTPGSRWTAGVCCYCLRTC
jgi:hypothetical protein